MKEYKELIEAEIKQAKGLLVQYEKSIVVNEIVLVAFEKELADYNKDHPTTKKKSK